MTPDILDRQAAVARAGSLRVLFAARWYPAFDDPGRGSFVADQARALVDAGVSVTVASWETAVRRGTYAAIDGPAPEPWMRALAEDAALTPPIPRSWGGGVPVVRIPAVLARRADAPADPLADAERQAESLLAVGMALAARQRIDVIHAHTGLPDGIAAVALAARLGVPLVVTEHDSTVASRLDSGSIRAAYRRLTGDGRQLLAVSDTLRRRLVDAIGGDEPAIRVVPNIVDVGAFVPSGHGDRDPDLLLWVGARRANKGSDVLLEAFGRLHESRPTLRLRLIGRAADPAEEARLVATARDLGVADSVSFEPAADRAGVAAAMARAAVFVHPSPYETFGIVAAEALAAGLPVAATPSGGVEEILGADGMCGEIAAGFDAAALAAAVANVLDRRTTFDPVVMRARVTERYAPASVAETLIATYRSLIVSPGRPSDGGPLTPGSVDDGTPGAAADPPVLLVGMRRSQALARVAGLPDDLARGLLVVTSVARRSDVVEAGYTGPALLHEVDPERTYREARARLGGPLPPRRRPARILRAIRHPVRAIRLRSLAARRNVLAVQTTLTGIRDAAGAIAIDDVPTLLLPLDADDADLCLPLLGERIRLFGSTLRGLADRWDGAGRPVREPAVAVATAVSLAGYDPARYWSQLHRRSDLSAVGQSGLPPEINGWLYRALARNLRAFLGRHRLIQPAPTSAFDVGVGTGYWVRFWRSVGVARVDGCDLVQGAVDAVRTEARAAGVPGEYWVADLGVEGSLPDTRYPMVSCMNVLLHIVDDEPFERALTGLAGLVAPGGVLVLAEPILFDAAYLRPYDRASQASRARLLAQYSAPLEAAGLELVDVTGGTAFANNPMEAGSARAFARYQRWWRFVIGQSRANAASARWLGPVMLGLDGIAMRLDQAPSTKFALFRRPGPGAVPGSGDGTPRPIARPAGPDR